MSLMSEAKKSNEKKPIPQHSKRPPKKHEPVSLGVFLKDYEAACAEKKLTPSPLVAAGIKNPFNRTYALELEAKKSMETESKVLDNENLVTLITLIGKKYPNAFKSLDFAHHGIDDKIAQEISALLVRSFSLEDLNLRGNSIGRLGCNSIIQTLNQMGGGNIDMLVLADNPIGDDAIIFLASLLATDPVLETLDLSNVEAGTVALVHLANALQTNTKLRVLNIDRPRKADQNDEETTIHLAKALRCNNKIRELSLAKHRMRTHGTMWLMEYITTWNNSVTTLNLSANQIPADGAVHIAKALADSSCKLQTLNLASNRLTDEGAFALAEALKKNSSLTDLDLSFASIEDEGLVALCNAVAGNVTLDTLKLAGNKFGSRAKKAWQSLLGWPVKEGGASGSVNLDIETLDFIP
eukprot:CAMPEP_0184494414 /NCGR_PEP_ID=MMETSP0113_2-20130426/28671_1 /TAXON_ID=91329 /ORGANISM="Norrisiella sphaerica, Strain BC52" /LENGTH=409 /DNA_ID=CAMNT_0026880161 /DNA_START=22 /DNA_END=1248 /DNA_ORIENTATION=-